MDVGANIGKYSHVLRDILGPYAIIYAFEPVLETFRQLAINTKEINIITKNFGLSDNNSRVTMYNDPNMDYLASIYERRLQHFDLYLNKKEFVEVRTLDTICKEEKINRIHFLKLDVEGHEFNVLQGALEMINNGAIDFIQFEFGGCNIDSRTFFQDFYYLLNSRYKLYRILKDGFSPINNYREEYESFKTTNYLAIRL